MADQQIQVKEMFEALGVAFRKFDKVDWMGHAGCTGDPVIGELGDGEKSVQVIIDSESVGVTVTEKAPEGDPLDSEVTYAGKEFIVLLKDFNVETVEY